MDERFHAEFGFETGVDMTRKPRVVEIPMPGGSGRISTGAVQFQDDWPGLFVRGDTAIMLSLDLSRILQVIRQKGLDNDTRVLCAIPRIEALIEIIERDVKVR